MAVERPTFHEAWYRVADLRPKLLNSVQAYRQHFRGQMWYVLENCTNNQYSRLSEEAYRFIAMLDGRRTVAQTWQICNEQLGDRAPTQPEVIQLLGQLYCSNLLHAQLPPDAESLFQRYKKRIKQQLQGQLTNLLFIRIPLFNPDRLLNRWVGIFGKIFSMLGLFLWVTMVSTGLYFVISNFARFVQRSTVILDPSNLLLLYISFLIIKIFHEFGHAFACKKFGILNGSGGQVHTMGVMFLVFFPLPYVDASSSWAFRKKWHRAIVGMSGVMVEIAVASIAAVIWATTSAGPVNTIAHNVMFVASVSTILFNGNPLLRFDGYYVFSDIIEIPNLSNRAKSYLCYIVKKYIWAVKKARNPANNRGEKIWFVFYGILAGLYRVFVCVRILLFLNKRLPEQLFLLVPLFAFGAIISWIFVPMGKFIRYLATGTELSRVRPRAIFTTLSTLVLLVSYLAVFKTTEHSRVEGIVEPVELSAVYSAGDGFVTDFFGSGQSVSPESPPLVKAQNRQLEAEKNMLEAENQSLEAKHRLAQTREPAEAQIYAEQLQALAERIERVNLELTSLDLHAPAAGVWVSPDIDTTKGTYLKRGQLVGYVVSLNEVLIRATADQQASAILIEQAGEDVEIRVKGRADLSLNGKIEKIFPAGQQRLPSAALGYAVGGAIATLAGDQKGTATAERFFEIQIAPDPNSSVRLLSGQRVVVRFKLHSKPLLAQWWRSVRQVFQRRFHI